MDGPLSDLPIGTFFKSKKGQEWAILYDVSISAKKIPTSGAQLTFLYQIVQIRSMLLQS